MPELDVVLKHRLDMMESQGLARQLVSVEREKFPRVIRHERPLISFACNDYLGLAQDARVIQASAVALQQYGAGAGASRLITGNSSLYVALERELSCLKKTETACVFGSGYLANIGTIPALMGKGDLILADKLVHACMIDGAQLSGAQLKRFAHNDMAHLETLLKTHRKDYGDCLILTETVFSMDGDVAPLDQVVSLAKRYDAWVMSDDAHGLGIIDSTQVDIQMGTLSKAAGAYGGYICGSRTLIDYITNRARSLIFTTALPPATLAAATAALQIIRSQPELGQKALANARLFTTCLGMDEAKSPIVPLIIGDAVRVIEASQTLVEAGYWVSAIRPPTVPAGTSRLRFTFSALHQPHEIQTLAECILRHGWIAHIDHQRLDAAS